MSLPALALVPVLVLWLGLHGWLAARQIAYLKRVDDPARVGAAITRARTGMLGTGAECGLGISVAGVWAGVWAGGWAGTGVLWPDTPPDRVPGAEAWGDFWAGAALITLILMLQALVRWTARGAAQGPVRALALGARHGALAGLCAAPVIVCVLGLWGQGLWGAAWAVWCLGIAAKIGLYPPLVAWVSARGGQGRADPGLCADFAGVMRRCGLRPSMIWVVSTPASGGGANAGCVGMGWARRVLVQNALRTRLTPAQIAAVLAHEAGHIQHAHHARHLVGICLAGLAGFALLAALPSGGGWPAMDLACAVLAMPALEFIGLRVPAVALRRHWELEADVFAARHVPPADLIAAITRLDAANGTLYAADPLYAAFFAFHPDPATRAAALGVSLSSYRPIVPPDGA